MKEGKVMEPRGPVIKSTYLILGLEGIGGNHQKTVQTIGKGNQ